MKITKYLCAALISSMLITGCGSKCDCNEVLRDEKENLWGRVSDHKVFDGTCTTKYDNGKTKEERQFRAGKPFGTWRTYYEDGKLNEEWSYNNEKVVSESKFYPDGKQKYQWIKNSDGTQHKLIKAWFEDGTLQCEFKPSQGESFECPDFDGFGNARIDDLQGGVGGMLNATGKAVNKNGGVISLAFGKGEQKITIENIEYNISCVYWDQRRIADHNCLVECYEKTPYANGIFYLDLAANLTTDNYIAALHKKYDTRTTDYDKEHLLEKE